MSSNLVRPFLIFEVAREFGIIDHCVFLSFANEVQQALFDQGVEAARDSDQKDGQRQNPIPVQQSNQAEYEDAAYLYPACPCEQRPKGLC